MNRDWRIYQDRPIYISKPKHLVMGILVGILFPAYTLANSTIVFILQWDLGIPGQAHFRELGLGQIPLRGIAWLLALTTFLFIYRFWHQFWVFLRESGRRYFD